MIQIRKYKDEYDYIKSNLEDFKKAEKKIKNLLQEFGNNIFIPLISKETLVNKLGMDDKNEYNFPCYYIEDMIQADNAYYKYITGGNHKFCCEHYFIAFQLGVQTKCGYKFYQFTVPMFDPIFLNNLLNDEIVLDLK